MALLENTGVAVMPGTSFGPALRSWLRLSLTRPDSDIEEACARIAAFAAFAAGLLDENLRTSPFQMANPFQKANPFQ